ncbi:MAG: hypothetical protein J1F63_08450 [Oscillospiraceae bacterium]|nr:hypothetical protein [Oscillospiraceae bacterium]
MKTVIAILIALTLGISGAPTMTDHEEGLSSNSVRLDFSAGLAPLTDEEIAGIQTYYLTASSDGTEEFRSAILEQVSDYYKDKELYNATPEGFFENYGFRLFTFSGSSVFLVYENEMYEIPGGHGYNSTSFAVSDVNGDGYNELYFIFTNGSGMIWDNVGYFDTKDKTIKYFDYMYDYIFVLGVDADGDIGVYYPGDSTRVDELPWPMNESYMPYAKIFDIVFDGNEITLASVNDDYTEAHRHGSRD